MAAVQSGYMSGASVNVQLGGVVIVGARWTGSSISETGILTHNTQEFLLRMMQTNSKHPVSGSSAD